MDEDRLDSWLGDGDEARSHQRMEVITGRRQRRQWTADEKAAIVAASAQPSACISDVARRCGVTRGLLTVWRRDAGITKGTTVAAGGSFAETVVEAPNLETCLPQPDTRWPGYIDMVVDGRHAVLSGDVDPALAVAVIGAPRRPR